MPNAARWDIFCRVVDNFGDAGVSWRLARLLATEHDVDVTLWIDVPAALARIVPAVRPGLVEQHVRGIRIRLLVDPLPAVDAADVVVEAFGCGLPDTYLAALTARADPAQWFVLEYLSAEAWVDGAHGLPSPHPQLPLSRRFWFPGFTARTGGLLRERSLFVQRDEFQRNDRARADLWAGLGVPPPDPGELRISLFCYPNPVLARLLAAWAAGKQRIGCVVPEGVAVADLDAWVAGLVPGPIATQHTLGRLAVYRIPFLDQDGFDRLLWACDLNFVRGEDSFVRAQWAGRPFVWHAYPQANGTHRAKLVALLDRYTAGLAAPVAEATRRFMLAWNGDPEAGDIGAAWLEFATHLDGLQLHGPEWAQRLRTLPELAASLVLGAAKQV